MKIHLISTGRVQITQSWREGNTSGLGRLANTLFDQRVTEWLQIYCAVIEHPDGLTVIDTGIHANANDPIYFPPHMRLIQRAARFDISAAQEIGVQMRVLGLNPVDVRRVILTHLHQDHDGGVADFRNAEFIVSRAEWNAAQGFKGRMSGYLNQRWFKGFAPTLIDFQDGAYYSFDASTQIAPDIRLVPTPGHSAGHVSVVLEQGDYVVFFAGDAAYTQDLLLKDSIDGVAIDPAAQQDSHRRIMQMATKIPLVFLPSHDPDSVTRLAARSTLPVESTNTGRAVLFA